MIKIDKTGVAIPNDFLTNGNNKTADYIRLFNLGVRRFKFDNTIYGSPSIKKELIRIQHDKCCFCERKVSAGEPGHIEHYRPKGGYKIDDLTPIVKPGYYWLAYNFDNLFYSCNRCNTSYKKNYFPLNVEGNRALNHNYDITLESPLIVNPSNDPSTDLIFVKEKIKPRGNSRKGRETIKRTGLNRTALSKERLEYLLLLNTLAIVARGASPESTEAKSHFKRISKAESVFSYMIRCNYPDLI